MGRRQRYLGTYHFYVGDYKAAAVWQHPDLLVNSRCTSAVEVNYSTRPDMPRVRVLHDIYKKRTLAAHWGASGIKLYIDLNIDSTFSDLALLGVPFGWAAYATRKQGGMRPEALEHDYQLASERAGGPPLFCVFGGGKKMRDYCLARDWSWIPERSDVVRGRAVAMPLES